MVPKKEKGLFQRLSEHLWYGPHRKTREPSAPQLQNSQELQVLQRPKEPSSTSLEPSSTLEPQSSGAQEFQVIQDPDEIQELQEPQEPQEPGEIQEHQEPQESQEPNESHNPNEIQEVQGPQEPQDPQETPFTRQIARLIRNIFRRRTPVVQIRHTGTERGRGVFAQRNLARNRIIIDEELPILTSDRNSLRADWNLTSLKTRREVASLFSRLANIPTDRALVADEPSEMIIENFRRDYAFPDPAGSRSLIYPVASHLNHACTDCANAEWFVDEEEPHRITVQATKRVRANKEIFINYRDDWGNLPFICSECAKKRAKENAELARRERFNRRLKRFACHTV
ncbi:Ff.00g092740.m01.CDS01 [Fusarium sp. VM40]|nr:Ff.00g092740.m01.CDS01 [Fusarium sp. VM40]